MALTQEFSRDAAVFEYAYTTGTGTYTLAGAVGGFLPFSESDVASGSQCYYQATDESANMEVVLGTYQNGGAGAETLTRDQILDSSDGGAAINWSGRTRVLIHLLNPTLPICLTPPQIGQALVWDGKEWCPGCPTCVDTTQTTSLPGVNMTSPSPAPPPAKTPPVLDNKSFGYYIGGTAFTAPATVTSVTSGVIQDSTSGPINGLALNTSHTYDVLVAFVATLSSASLSSGGASAAPSVAGISGTGGLTWMRRGAISAAVKDSTNTFYGNARLELWYAVAPAALSNARFTATLSGAARAAIIGVDAFYGVGLPQIWDSNAALPAVQAYNPGAVAQINLTTSSAGAEIPVVGDVEWIAGFLPTPATGWEDLAGSANPAYGTMIAAGETAGVTGPVGGMALSPWVIGGAPATQTNGFLMMADALVGS